MGFKIACLAVDLADKENTLTVLGLRKTQNPDEYNEMPHSGATAKNGKYVIWKNDSSADFSKAERDALEKSISFISMGIHEGVMSGHVDQVSNGTTDWRIEYVGCEDPTIFSTTGNVPDVIKKMHQTFKTNSIAEGDDVDLEYEILSETFKYFSGHKYDIDNGFEFFELEAVDSKAKKKPWWKFFN